MARGKPAFDTAKYDVKVASLDLSQLVGFQLRLFSEQFRGKEVRAKVVASAGRTISIENIRQREILDNLVNRQKVILQFPYRGQEISVRAKLRKTGSGRCSFNLDDVVTPLSQRRFHRVDLTSKVTLAPFPSAGFLSRKLSKLRWMETEAVNFSAGGILVEVPTPLDNTARLLINLKQDYFAFPSMVLGKVRHCYHIDEWHCRTGVEFVTMELARRLFSPFQMDEMPAMLFNYHNSRREQLNRVVREWDETMNLETDTGVDDEKQ